MVMSSDADSSTVGKPWISAFQFATFCWILTSGRSLKGDFESEPLICEISWKSQNSSFCMHFPWWNLHFYDFHWILKIRGLDSKSMFRYLLEVKIQPKVANWKAEIQGFPTVEESASEDITISVWRISVKRLKNQRLRTAERPDSKLL